VAAFQDAVRAGRTLATNGPWLELAAAGHGPGDRLTLPAGTRVPVSARVQGAEADRLELVGPDGVLARATRQGDQPPAVDTEVEVADSLWLCAVARGPGHPAVLGPAAFAHTSPVHLEAAGRPVRRPASARWLLDWLDRFETLVKDHGRFADPAQRDQVLAVIDQARPFYRALR
jgi:hypothetical protein